MIDAEDPRTWLDRQVSSLGVPYELFRCDPALADTAAFCAAYGFALEDSANTIVVIGKSHPPFYAAACVVVRRRLGSTSTRPFTSGSGRAEASFAARTRPRN